MPGRSIDVSKGADMGRSDCLPDGVFTLSIRLYRLSHTGSVPFGTFADFSNTPGLVLSWEIVIATFPRHAPERPLQLGRWPSEDSGSG